MKNINNTVKNLKLETFIVCENDWELNQYRVLAGIKEYRSDFNRNKLYPALAELVYLASRLDEILSKKNNLTLNFPKRIKNFNEKDKSIIIETLEQKGVQGEYYYDLIEWAIPVIKEAIDEAYVLYEFVENNINIEEVGIPSFYKEEGFLLVPDNLADVLQAHRYECSVYSSGQKPFRSLKTKYLQSMQRLNFSGSADFIKMELTKKYNQWSNPATFICETELDFPFIETIFPIAKRKLLKKIEGQ